MPLKSRDERVHPGVCGGGGNDLQEVKCNAVELLTGRMRIRDPDLMNLDLDFNLDPNLISHS